MGEQRGVLIGCGFFARNHMHAWTGIPGLRIVAVCDTDPAKADAFARAFGVKAYADAEAMLTAERPDFADIATTVASHRALVEMAAGHARVIICQKPFAATYADGQAMVGSCAAMGTTLVVHENFRWQAPFRVLKVALDAGQVGEVRHLSLSFRHAYDIYADQPYLAQVGDLALTDIGLHLFDLARHLAGDVASVACQTQRRNARVTGQDAFTALLRHQDGAVSVVDASFQTHLAPDPFPETSAVVEGDDGTLEVTQGYRLRLHRDGDVTETDVEPDVPAWGARPWHGIQDSVVAFQTHVAEVLAGRALPQPSGAHNLGTLAVTLAAIRAAKTGTTIDVAAFRAGGCL
jgi:D-apiose dehydrogenase